MALLQSAINRQRGPKIEVAVLVRYPHSLIPRCSSLYYLPNDGDVLINSSDINVFASMKGILTFAWKSLLV